MEEEIGDARWVMAQITHKRADFVGNVLRNKGQLARVDRTFQSMIQIFIRIVFGSIGGQEKHLNSLRVFFQPDRNKFAVVDL